LKLKTKVLGAASALALAGGLVSVAAPAIAAVTSAGSCHDAVSLIKLTGPVKGQGLGDQTVPVKIAGNLAKDLTTKTVTPNAGSCTGTVTRVGDAHIPNGNNPALTPKSAAVSFVGDQSCAQGATATAVDATKANAYTAYGKLTWTFTQNYNDLINAAPKPYKMQAAITLLGFNPGGVDVVDIGGTVLSGASAGATVVGNIWEDPVVLAPHGTDPNTTLYKTGYNVDLNDAIGCADGTAGNANITAVLSSGGGTHNVSPLGGTATGLAFQFGE
jgi:hypothetical protein